MSLYSTSPFKPTPLLLVQGTPQYLFGSWPTDTGPTQGNVISDSGNGTTSTVTFQILSGNIPKVDELITIVGTANAALAYNVTNASILTVSTTTAGICTVTFLGTGTSATATDGGQVIILRSEFGDVITPGGAVVSSAPVVSPAAGPNSVGKSLSVSVKLPASTAANPNTLAGVSVVLQGSNIDLDSEYNTIATITPTPLAAGGVTVDWQSGQGDTATGTLAAGSVNLVNFRFYRVQVSTGASGTGPIISKIMQ
jgi:hypothetical protein